MFSTPCNFKASVKRVASKIDLYSMLFWTYYSILSPLSGRVGCAVVGVFEHTSSTLQYSGHHVDASPCVRGECFQFKV